MRPPWLLPVLAGLVVVALVSSSVAVVQWRQADRAEAELAATRDELAALRAEVARLEEELDRATSSPGPLGGLEGLLEGLFGGTDGDTDGEAGGGGLGGLLEDLFGDRGAEQSGSRLGDLFGGDTTLGGATHGAACLTQDTSAAGGAGTAGDRSGLGGLLDGLMDGLGGRSGDEAPSAVVDRVTAQVAELRELAWHTDVEVDLLDDRAVLERLDGLLAVASDDPALDAHERLLVALRAVPADTDLAALQRQLLDDQVAGFYVPDTGELVVRVPDDGRLAAMDQVVLAHELGHALTDQALGLPDRTSPPLRGDTDASLAALAVLEGDATLLMQRWALQHLTITDQLSMLTDPRVTTGTAPLDGVPHVVAQELLFPYTAGLDWACDRWLDRGWAGVDAAYRTLPATTAEILHGEPVTTRSPVDVDPPPGHRLLRSTTFGAAQLQWLFEAPGDDPARALADPADRARAWGGGHAHVFVADDDTTVALTLVDGGTGSAPLCGSMRAWLGASRPDAEVVRGGDTTTFTDRDGAATLRCTEDDVVVGVADDAPTARTLATG